MLGWHTGLFWIGFAKVADFHDGGRKVSSQHRVSTDSCLTVLCRGPPQDRSSEGSHWAAPRPRVLQGKGKAADILGGPCQTAAKARIRQQSHLCFPAFLPAPTTELNWILSVDSYFQTLSNHCKEVLKGLAVFMLLLVFNKSCIYNAWLIILHKPPFYGDLWNVSDF